jgi:hypothetical protein
MLLRLCCDTARYCGRKQDVIGGAPIQLFVLIHSDGTGLRQWPGHGLCTAVPPRQGATHDPRERSAGIHVVCTVRPDIHSLGH